MGNATRARERVSRKRLHDVLTLFINSDLRAKRCQDALNDLWGKWGACVCCNTTIALAAPVLWNGEGFVHAGHEKSEEVVPWDEVFLPGYRDSVAERLRQKQARDPLQVA